MRITSDGKHRRTRSEWETLVSRYRASGLSFREFAKQERLSVISLQRWSQLLAAESSNFMEVSPAASGSAGPNWRAELELPGGLILRIVG